MFLLGRGRSDCSAQRKVAAFHRHRRSRCVGHNAPFNTVALAESILVMFSVFHIQKQYCFVCFCLLVVFNVSHSKARLFCVFLSSLAKMVLFDRSRLLFFSIMLRCVSEREWKRFSDSYSLYLFYVTFLFLVSFCFFIKFLGFYLKSCYLGRCAPRFCF